jgi:drug/metabolite transporter (DMT)-like permease
MKKGVVWIGWRGPKGRPFRAALAVWTAGFLLSNLYVVPAAVALKALEAPVVAAFAGWGVVVLVFLSGRALGERLRRSDTVFAALIVAGLAGLSLFELPASGRSPVPRAAYFAAAAVAPFLPAVAALLVRRLARARAALWAAAAGFSSGLLVVTVKILVAAFGFRISAYFGSVYFYAYLGFSLGAFGALQAAFKSGGMMTVGPVQYTAAILYPALLGPFLFGRGLHPVQAAGIAAVVLGVAGLLRPR